MSLPQEIIRLKRDGGVLSSAEIESFVRGSTAQKGTEEAWEAEQLAAMLMATFWRGMNDSETAALTAAMMQSGTVLALPSVRGTRVDKHSTGGVGDKISIPLAPLVAACGVPVPMISGRGLGHTGGTLDKLESIPGFRTDLDARSFEACVAKHGLCLIGQTDDLAPADRRLYALRDVTATVECIPLIVSSILSKKLAEGIDALVLDVKCGSGAFMPDRERARELAHALVGATHAMGKRVSAFVTDMNQPLGIAIGNANEVRESIDILCGGGPPDVRALTVALGAEMLRLAGVEVEHVAASARIEQAIQSGAGAQKFEELIAAQGGDARVVAEPQRLAIAPDQAVYRAAGDGYVRVRDCRLLGVAALELGAGRRRAADPIDPAVGLMWRVRQGASVRRGEVLVELQHRGRGVDAALAAIDRALEIVAEAPMATPLIFERVEIGADGVARSHSW